MILKDFILIISLIGNVFILYDYSNVVKKVSNLENKYELIQMQLEHQNVVSQTLSPNNYLLYGALSIFIVLAFVVFNNSHFSFVDKADTYQEDNIEIYKEILSNLSTEKVSFIFSQLQTIITNQQIIIRQTENLNSSSSLVLDPAAYELADQLARISASVF